MYLNSLYIGTEHQYSTPPNPRSAASTCEESEAVGMGKEHENSGRFDDVESPIPHMRDRDDQHDGNSRGGGYHREQKGPRGSSIQNPGSKSNQRGARKSVPSDRHSLTPYEGPPPGSQLTPLNQPPMKPKSPPSAAAAFSTGNNICVFMIKYNIDAETECT